MRLFVGLCGASLWLTGVSHADDWPRWRGPGGNALSAETELPLRWSTTENVRWRVELPGEGSSSPVVVGGRAFVTYALDRGDKRGVLCLDRRNGGALWSREIEDPNAEITSVLTGHAAATPVVADGRVVAMFGNAGAVCCSTAGGLLWRKGFGEFVTEFGLASSPIVHKGRVILVCDHDGNRFKTFDSFLIALDLATGETVWKTERPMLYRSWSTPIVVPAPGGKEELIVSAQDELRGYDPHSGELLWHVRGTAGWVTPSPVFHEGVIYATSGKDAPTLAVRPGGRGDVTDTHVLWKVERGGPYVCSPVFSGGRLYVHDERGFMTCYDARDGTQLYRQRLGGKFTSSSIVAAGRVYLTNEEGTTFVLQDGPEFKLLAENRVEAEVLASPAASQGELFLRTERHLYCITGGERPQPATPPR